MTRASKATTRNATFDRKIGQRLRLHRNACNITQEVLAEKLRITFQQVQKYESGTNAIPSTRVPELCKALRITPNDLFGL